MKRGRFAPSAVAAATMAMWVFGFASPAASDTTGQPPSPEPFVNTSISVIAGSQVSLHWHAAQGESFLLTSTAPAAVPNFGSTSRVAWPAGSSSTWNGLGWNTTAAAMTLTVPATARAGTVYRLQLATCSSTTQLCSNSLGSAGLSQVTLTVASGWSSTALLNDFSRVTRTSNPAGEPLDVAWSSDHSLWASSEFSAGVTQVPVSKNIALSYPVQTNLQSEPFAMCFLGSCAPSGYSALSERIVLANGQVWFSQGGWLFDTDGTVPNNSDIVALNPISKTTCSYMVPDNDSNVIGLAVTGTRPNSTVWFAESSILSGDTYLDSFNPDSIGDACPGTANESYSLAGSMQQFSWPGSGAPAQIAVDPSSNALWVTDWLGSAVYRLDLTSDTFSSYHMPSSNRSSILGAMPWQVVADGRYVYAIDYGDNNLVRISPSTGVVDEVPIPLTSDTEQGYGLALYGGRLYFTLSDDGQPTYGAASTFGYVDVASWEAASALCPVGSDCAPSPPLAVTYKAPSFAQSDLRGIAIGADGTVAMADLHQIVRVSP